MPMNGYEKAAIFLTMLNEENAAEVLKGLDVAEIGKITMYMNRVKTVQRDTLGEVLRDASGRISQGSMVLGGQEFVRNVLSRGLGEERATKVLEMAARGNPLDLLNTADAKTLSELIASEHPQTVALVICLLQPAKAAEVLSALPEEIKSEVAMRVATTERIPECALEALQDVLRGQLDVSRDKGKKVGGAKTIAEILNRCDRNTEQEVIGKIEEHNNLLADSIRNLMFMFDDLVNVDDRGIQTILKEVSSEDLSLALKTASDALKEKIFKNMSQRAAGILKEEMQVRGPVKVSDVEKAQQNIVKVARKLESEGRIVIGGRGGEELVV